jgi:hypothetical protein
MIAWLKKRIHQEMRRIAAGGHYRPERHYMRGPGPKSAARAMPGDRRRECLGAPCERKQQLGAG